MSSPRASACRRPCACVTTPTSSISSARPEGEPVGRLIPIEDIEPNPDQPRQALGDLSELTASIREKGILEPILVRPVGGRFQIIAGERRYRAAVEAGLDEFRASSGRRRTPRRWSSR